MTCAVYSFVDPFIRLGLLDHPDHDPKQSKKFAVDRILDTVDSCGGVYGKSDDKNIVVSLDVPGVKAEDIDIKLEDGILAISGVRKYYNNGNKNDQDAAAMKKRKFSYTMDIDEKEINTTEIKANLSDGVLVITIPKLPKSKPVTVTITNKPHEAFEEKNVKDAIDDTPSKKA